MHRVYVKQDGSHYLVMHAEPDGQEFCEWRGQVREHAYRYERWLCADLRHKGHRVGSRVR